MRKVIPFIVALSFFAACDKEESKEEAKPAETEKAEEKAEEKPAPAEEKKAEGTEAAKEAPGTEKADEKK